VLGCTLIFFRRHDNPLLSFFKDYAFVIGFLLSLGAVLLSLFYSNVIGFPACELCWIYRIFIYPQVILFGMEIYKRDRAIVDQCIVLTSFAVLTSLFHIYVENGGASSLSCAVGGTAQISCATRYVYEFGYITIPVMAFSVAVFLLTLLLNYKYMTRK
jgi:disulfide bond formation protein DsbB